MTLWVVALLTSGCGLPATNAPARPGGVGGSCVADEDAELQDIDEDDSPETPWPHTPGQEVVVYFETRALTPRYEGFLRTAAEYWSRSPCIDARVAERCPVGANCSTVVLAERSRDRDTDGESAGRDRDGVRRGNQLTFYTEPLDASSDNGALATVVHEMGHAVGLVHRLDEDDVMNAVTGNDTDPEPDDIDYANLIVIYGGGSVEDR